MEIFKVVPLEPWLTYVFIAGAVAGAGVLLVIAWRGKLPYVPLEIPFAMEAILVVLALIAVVGYLDRGFYVARIEGDKVVLLYPLHTSRVAAQDIREVRVVWKFVLSQGRRGRKRYSVEIEVGSRRLTSMVTGAAQAQESAERIRQVSRTAGQRR